MKHLTILLGLLLLMPGCVRSLHPFYTDPQVVYDPTVNGIWTDTKGENKLSIEGDADHKQYNLAYTDEHNKTGHFEVHLAQIENQTIADVAPASPVFKDDQGNDAYVGLLLPAHSCLLVTYNAQTIRIRAMNFDWFKKYVKDHPDAIKVERLESDDDIILAAPTEMLQAFVLKNISTEGAWGDSTEFHWISPTTKP